MADTVEQIELTRLSLPLKVPYKLAFGPVVAFDTLIAEIRTDQGTGIGEATVLEGYTTETVAFAWARAQEIAAGLVGGSVAVAKARLAGEAHAAPFTACMFQTALEMAAGHPVLDNPTDARVPLLFGLNPTDPAGIERALAEARAGGYDTVKVKVGFDVDDDLARVALIQEINAGRQQFRIDGNQGYGVADAVKFATRVQPAAVELLEQPCHMDDWAGLAEVAKVTAVPLMLDESIYGDDDIDRAAEIGSAYVKLKLMKLAGLDALAASIGRIRSHGMGVVLGNGVASDIGCWMELCVARDLVTNAGEMNGFLRPSASVVMNPVRVEDGDAVLPAGYCPKLDRDALAMHTVESRHFG